MKEQIKEQYEKEYGEIDRIERMAEEESLNFYDELPSKKFNRRDMREAYKTGLLKIALTKAYRTHHSQDSKEFNKTIDFTPDTSNLKNKTHSQAPQLTFTMTKLVKCPKCSSKHFEDNQLTDAKVESSTTQPLPCINDKHYENCPLYAKMLTQTGKDK